VQDRILYCVYVLNNFASRKQTILVILIVLMVAVEVVVVAVVVVIIGIAVAYIVKYVRRLIFMPHSIYVNSFQSLPPPRR